MMVWAELHEYMRIFKQVLISLSLLLMFQKLERRPKA
jgi:hypothetical protein